MIGLSVRRPVAVAMGCAAVVALGIASFANIPVELLPDVRFPQLTIHAQWYGATPEAVEAFVTSPLEGAARQVTGARNVRSVSTEGRAEVTVEFARGTDMEFAELELGERLAALQDVLPPRVVPRIEPYVPREFSAQDVPFMEYALYGTFTTEGLRQFAEDRLRPALLGVEGATAVRLYGGEPREIRIELNPARMEALGLRVRDVAEALSTLDAVFPSGALVRKRMHVVASVEARVTRPQDLAALVLVPDTAGSGRLVRLGNVARILDTRAEPREYHRINGRPAITMWLVRGLGTNAIRVADRVRAKVTEMRPAFPAGVDLVLRRDESTEIRRQLTDLRLRAAASAIVVLLVLLLFLGSFRMGAIVFSTIAFATLLAVNFLYLTGLSLNILTLAGLAMGFGLIVDNAIVVLESANRRWRGGEPGDVAAERGARQVALPILASTLTTLIVFVPFLYLQGGLRIYYLPFAYAVGLALLASLVVAFTLVPAVAAKAFRGPPPVARAGKPVGEPLYVRFYRGLVAFLLRQPWAAVAVTILVFAGSYRLFDKHVVRGPAWGRWGEETRIDVIIDLPRGSDLERADELARHFEAKLATLPEVEEFVTYVRPAAARIRATFPDSLERTWIPVAIKEQMVAYSHFFGGAEVRVYGFGPSFYGGGFSPPNYALKILGYNYGEVREIAEDLGRRLRRFARIRDVDTNATDYWFEREKATEVVLAVDRARLGAYGATVREVLEQVAAAVGGQVAWNRIRLGGVEVNVSVKLARYDRMDTQALEDLLVPTGAGRVRLGEVAQLGEREVLNRIVREDQQYQRVVAYEFRGPVKLGDRVRDAVVAATALPPGYAIEKERRFGWIEREEERQIYGVLLLSVLLIYMVTAALFESLRGPLVVLLTVPLALIGVFLIFFYTGATFTRSAYIGVIMMAGIVVNNAILLVHHVNELRRVGGLPLEPAILRGTLERVRPILMTSATTIGGMLPLVLFSESADANIWNALGYALIGGLASSTLFVLTVTPALCLLLERGAERRRAA